MKIYFILRKLLINLGILERIGYQALGEKNTYFINPFKNNSLNIIYTSHNLEHLTSETSDNFFRECKRLLKRNGEILIEVPDAEYIHMNALNYIKDEQFHIILLYIIDAGEAAVVIVVVSVQCASISAKR